MTGKFLGPPANIIKSKCPAPGCGVVVWTTNRGMYTCSGCKHAFNLEANETDVIVTPGAK